MKRISYSEFDQVDMRVGRILEVRSFPEARTPSYLLDIDFGESLGVRRSAAALADDYQAEELDGRAVIAVVNFPAKQIANHISEVLVLAAVNSGGGLKLLVPDEGAELGARIS